jgi:hypothetical protein
MVGLIGLEPMTLRLSSACSNQLSYRPICAYAQSTKFQKIKIEFTACGDVEAGGFEPPTSSLQSWRSTN